LTDIAALQTTVQEIVRRFGSVDVLVNNAGDDTRHSVESVTSESWDRTMAINLKQQFFMVQAVAPAMRAARRGSIINMGSIAWVIPSTNVPVYVAAKAAIVGMTRTLAHEFGGEDVRVNCVMPGAIVTERQEAALVHRGVQSGGAVEPGAEADDSAGGGGEAGVVSCSRR